MARQDEQVNPTEDGQPTIPHADVLATIPALLPGLESVYLDLHQHPELSGQEQRTAGIAAAALRSAGFEVTEGVGGYGVVGVLTNGDGPVVWVRADMDALPVKENTGLEYASTATGIDPDGNEVPVAHVCGHDMHVAVMMGASAVLAATRHRWSGTLVVIFQPAEELLGGSDAMIADGMLERFPHPDVVLGQHVAPLPASTIFYREGAALAGSDVVQIRLFGKGGHGSRPETTIDPIVMAASLIMRLQTIVAREIPPSTAAVVTVGSVVSGNKDNIIPDEALLKMTVRSFTPEVRSQLLSAIERMAKAEALASGAPTEPEITYPESAPVLNNDPAATARVVAALTAVMGPMRVIPSPQPGTGSEDFGQFGTAAKCPSVFWFLGGADLNLFLPPADAVEVFENLPSNHSPEYAPVIEPTLQTGIEAMVLASLAWLAAPVGDSGS